MNATRPRICARCRGARHVLVDGKWRRCDCAVREVREIAYRAAGVPELYLAGNTVDYYAAWGGAWNQDHPPGLVWLRGPRLGQRRARACAYALRDAVDRGEEAASLSLRDGVEARFDREAGLNWARVVRDARTLVVDLEATAHKYLPDVAAELWARRSLCTGTTVYVSEGDVGAMPGLYGAAVAQEFARSRGLLRVSTFKEGRR